MKLIRWLTIILAIPVSSVAQLQYDSLIQALHGSRKEGNVKGEVLACSHLGYFFWQTEHYDSALRYYHRVLKYPQWSLNPEIDASSKNALGVVYSLLRLSDSSIYYYQEAWKAYK
jgi:tetratricopeptide (TPR) repeat protein